MADALSGTLGGLAGSVQNQVNRLTNLGTGWLDQYFPPDKRAVLWAKFNKFMTERPKLGAFLLSQIALSGVPLGLFAIMTITVAVFAIIAALLIGLVGALVFIVFAIGFALIFLLPTLFFTTAVATFLFLFGLGAYYIVKWFNEKDIPGIHVPLGEGLKNQLFEDNGEASEKDKVPALTQGGPNIPDEAEGYRGENGEDKEAEKHASKAEKGRQKQQNGSAKKEGGGGVDGTVDNVGKSTGLDTGAVGDVKKKADVGNVTKNADLGNVTNKADVGNVAKTAGGLKDSVPGGVL